MTAVVTFTSSANGAMSFSRTALVSFPPPSLIPQSLHLVGDASSTSYLVLPTSSGAQTVQFVADTAGMGQSMLNPAAYKTCFFSVSNGIGFECSDMQMIFGPSQTTVRQHRLDENLMCNRCSVHCPSKCPVQLSGLKCNSNYRQALIRA